MIEYYRNKSSFNSQLLEEFIDSKEVVDLKNEVFSIIQNDPLFHRSPVTLSLDEIRKNAQLRSRRLIDYGLINDTKSDTEPLYMCSLLTLLAQYDLAILFKTVISTHFFGACIRGMGSLEQQKYFVDVLDEKISGCFALTEIGHGSNARGIRTTATYDPQTQQFILHSEDFQAAKCWIGNMGQSATYAVVFAQLLTADGQNQGLHGFITPIRDPNTHLPFPGIILGDMGEKIGLNGMDNGFCMFNQYRIPKENLLSKFGIVTDDGEYLSPISDPRKRFALSLGTLLGGRIMVLSVCIGLLTNAITIAIRYSAVRKQFGPTDNEELSIIEYPLQQWRLFPHLAALFAMKATARTVYPILIDLFKIMVDPNQTLSEEYMNTLMELHPLLSALKVIFSWTCQTAIQQCREACGGHGYLKCAGLGDLRNDNDGNCTYEGDNNVLHQQTSNWLVQLWKRRNTSCPHFSLHSADFLYQTRPDKMLGRSVQEFCQPSVILEAYRWLICWLAEKTIKELETQAHQGKDRFTARNHAQVYRARSLTLAYGEHYMTSCMWELCCRADQHSTEAQVVLTKVCALYGLSSLDKHLVFLHQGGYIDAEQSQLIQATILSLCEELKNEAVTLVDVIAPPDFILNSALGHSSGEVYKQLEQTFFTTAGNMHRPEWWPELSGRFRARL